MATISSPSIPDQEQLQPQESLVPVPVPVPEAVSSSNSAWHSSGSIGPFFAVISVLTVLAILSCFLGRICKGRSVTPLESIKHGGFLGWLRRKCCGCLTSDAEILSNKSGVVQNDCNVGKAQEGV